MLISAARLMHAVEEEELSEKKFPKGFEVTFEHVLMVKLFLGQN